MHTTPLKCGLLATLFLYLVQTATAQSPTYDIRDLGDLGGGNSSAKGINNAGQVVGDALTPYSTHAFLYTAPGMRDLGVLMKSLRADRDASSAYATNNNGQVVGTSTLPYYSSSGFLYSNGIMQPISLLFPLAINDAGQIAGIMAGSTAAFYNNGVTTALSMTTTNNSAAWGINNRGQIVGRDGNNAFLYDNGVEQILPPLPFADTTVANGINDSGQIVGTSGQSSGGTHATLWQNGQVQDLGTLGGQSSTAYAISKYGVIVGSSDTLSQGGAFVYQNGQMTDIFTGSGWQYGVAHSINDVGQIVGVGYAPTGPLHAFLATPYYTVAGNLALDGLDNPGILFSELFTFTLTPKVGGAAIVQTQVLSTGGAFVLSHVPFGDYTLMVKASKWLSASQSVSLVTSGVSNLHFALRGGDANGDNKVDINDFGVLVNSYGADSEVSGSGYDVRADFNDDGVVDIADFGILINNYGNSGQ